MKIKIKRLTPTAFLPVKAHPADACYDIFADIIASEDTVGNVTIQPKEAVTIHTGFATELPIEYFAAVFDRSGMGIKRHLRLSNSVGIIDSNYRGEWMVALYNDGTEPQTIYHGDRIAQFAVLPVFHSEIIEVTELEDSDRGAGGFGSTGN